MSLFNKVVQSSALLISIKLVQRLLGLISLIILARLLTPDDFAIVALSAIVVYFFDVLSQAGSEQYIIQKTKVSTDDLNTAWTIDIIMKFIMMLLLILSSPFIAQFFNQPALENVLYVASIVLLIDALKNPGIYLFKQDLAYKSLFWLSVFQKLLSFILVISIAYYYRTYWALIIGDILSSLIFTAGTYYIHHFKPKWSLTHKKQQWSFSKWLLLKNIVGYIRAQVDTLFVSKFFPSAQIGQYYMTRNIAMLPAQNILTPAIEPLLASFSVDKNAPKKLTKQINLSLILVSVTVIPMCIFIAFFANSIVQVLLGEQWIESATTLTCFALLLFYFPYILVLEQALIVKNWLKRALLFDVASLLLVVAALLFSDIQLIEEVAIIRGSVGIFSAFILAIMVKRAFNFSGKMSLATMLISGIFATLAALLSQALLVTVSNPIIYLLCAAFIFSITYLLATYMSVLLMAKFNAVIAKYLIVFHSFCKNKVNSILHYEK